MLGLHIIRKNMSVCFLELYSNNKIKKITIRPCCFDESLCCDTILYGTLIENRFFYIENILFLLWSIVYKQII